MTPEVMTLVAARFKALADPARLLILDALRDGELTVGDLVDATDLNQANVSKHLKQLHDFGFVKRRKDGLFVYYSLADRKVLQLCAIMCDRLEMEAKKRRKVLAL
jgi:ArsR family transcriptional regulator